MRTSFWVDTRLKTEAGYNEDIDEYEIVDMELEPLKRVAHNFSELLEDELSKEEIEEIVKQVIEETGASSMKDMGMVMKGAKEKIGASADGKTINEIVKALLN